MAKLDSAFGCGLCPYRGRESCYNAWWPLLATPQARNPQPGTRVQ